MSRPEIDLLIFIFTHLIILTLHCNDNFISIW